VSRRISNGAGKVAPAECTGEGAGALAALCPSMDEDGAPAGDDTACRHYHKSNISHVLVRTCLCQVLNSCCGCVDYFVMMPSKVQYHNMLIV